MITHVSFFNHTDAAYAADGVTPRLPELNWRPFLVSDALQDCPHGFHAIKIADTHYAFAPITTEAWRALPSNHPWIKRLNEFVASQNWCVKTKTLCLEHPLIMGIWNASPESFSSDHNLELTTIEFAQKLLADGADVIDIGAESTSPTASPLTPEDEVLRLTQPLIWAKDKDFPLSVDTYHPQTMRFVADYADIINDISRNCDSIERDSEVFKIVRDAKMGYVIMAFHTHDNDFPTFDSCINSICDQLERRLDLAFALGVDFNYIVTDPGIGFGKGLTNDLKLIKQAPRALASLGRPVLIGHSRKRCIGLATKTEVQNRDVPTAIATAIAIEQGAKIIRVHDPAYSVMARSLVETTSLC